MPDQLLQQAVADRHAAGDGDMSADRARELDEAEEAGPAAVDFGDPAIDLPMYASTLSVLLYISPSPRATWGRRTASAGILAPLAEDEDLGFRLLHSLDDRRQQQAVVDRVARADYATRQVPFVGKVEYPDYVGTWASPGTRSTTPTARR